MFIHTQVSIPDVFVIFCLTPGLLKALGPFAQATRGAGFAARRTMARRAPAITTAIVIGVASFNSSVLEQWPVSEAALVVSGSIMILRKEDSLYE